MASRLAEAMARFEYTDAIRTRQIHRRQATGQGCRHGPREAGPEVRGL